MELFRIVKTKYSNGLFSSGSAGRWNLEDQHVLYASSSRALATLELVVHQSRVNPNIDYTVLVLTVPEEFIPINVNELSRDWRSLAAYFELQQIGSRWYHQKSSLLLRVPSAVIPKEHNFIINTKHPQFDQQVTLKDVEECFWDIRKMSGN